MPPLSLADLNPALLNVEYAVRGELAIKAEEYRERLQRPNHGLPFTRVIGANIGNPQAKGLDQKPITFSRQVAALTEYPPLLETGKALFPPDVIARAKELIHEIGSVGAYSHSQGVPLVRKHVAEFIQARDGYPSDPSNIFLTAGASEGVSLLINMLISTPNAGILIPIPQYPLYTATLAQHAGVPVPYLLDETSGWSTAPDDVERAVEKAIAEGTRPRALVVINPGNPTGSVLDEPTMRRLVQLAEKHALVLLADEVYQDNLHHRAAQPFISFKQVVAAAQSRVPLVSFHSISKGVSGECGRRGGYFETVNISAEVRALIYKMRSVTLCPPLGGQVGVDCLVRPPRAGDASYALWREETEAIHAALRERTRVMAARLNQLEGVSCVDSPGALYLFPRIRLTAKACAAARAAGKEPDAFYALAMLDDTGICTVPGSGFGQRDGEQHYRLTCLCEGVDEYVGALETFHRAFMAKYRD
ncbi:pyridoxal phosphate-dependent transferase [Gautieria morchelliformis]|nr:pyridoxal phosphate-dependent transferase [Gautieria morchelliformis]